jgi:hypothetical protein
VQTTHQNNQLTDTTDLGLAMLIIESEEGHYEPISVVSSIREAREIANTARISRAENLERGGEPFCPDRYVMWARGANVYRDAPGRIPRSRPLQPMPSGPTT